MDDALPVGVLHRVADILEQAQPPARAEMMYDLTVRGESAGLWIEIERAED